MTGLRPDAATLSRLYCQERLSVAGLAGRFHVAPQTVHNWLVAAGVGRRPAAAVARADVDDEQLRCLYVDEGRTAAEIAAAVGCSPSLVYRRLQRMAVPRRPPRPRRSSRPTDTQLRGLYVEAGLSLAAIGERFGVTAQAVAGWLATAGIARRPSAERREVDEVAELYAQGWSAPALSARFGCSPATVYRRLKEAGVPRRSPAPRLSRELLLAALGEGLGAAAMAPHFGVSVTTVCRSLAREGLQTASQVQREVRARRWAQLLENIERAHHGDEAAVEWLRHG